MIRIERITQWLLRLFSRSVCTFTEWRMKTKWRFFFAGALAVVLFGSYKILEPELFRQAEPYDPWNKQPFEAGKDLKDGPKEIIVNRPFELRPDVVMNGNVEVDPGAVSVDKVIKSMVDRFTPLHSYKIHESPWDIAASWVGPRQIHRENAPQLGAVLSAMARGKITLADFGVKGTQLKLTLTLDHKQKVVFKPAWYGRDDIITGTPYSGRDRHNAEIAAFHLGRILELRRTPLAIGRRVDHK
ncbi:extracellular serine/threonine protein kinase CeFam20, partial [Aplysia californica]|uniref:Extracellular serine/threonine protein kinase CeFam20 n=1 Tax=Aplysia californica TaxID=6500 RepID=A0ABM0KB46_APLCA